MPVQSDAPIGIGQWDEWALWGSAADKLQAVATNDGDTGVIYAASGGRGFYQTFRFPPLLGIGDPVASASITAVVREYAHGAGHILYLLFGYVDPLIPGETDLSGIVHAAGGAYVAVSRVAAGAELAAATVNGQHSIGFSGAGGPSNKAEFWCTQFYRSVDYNYGAAPAAGDFTHIIGSVVGAMIGSGLSLSEMPAVSEAMRKRARKWLRPDELETAWRAWREYKHPAWSVRASEG